MHVVAPIRFAALAAYPNTCRSPTTRAIIACYVAGRLAFGVVRTSRSSESGANRFDCAGPPSMARTGTRSRGTAGRVRATDPSRRTSGSCAARKSGFALSAATSTPSRYMVSGRPTARGRDHLSPSRSRSEPVIDADYRRRIASASVVGPFRCRCEIPCGNSHLSDFGKLRPTRQSSRVRPLSVGSRREVVGVSVDAYSSRTESAPIWGRGLVSGAHARRHVAASRSESTVLSFENGRAFARRRHVRVDVGPSNAGDPSCSVGRAALSGPPRWNRPPAGMMDARGLGRPVG